MRWLITLLVGVCLSSSLRADDLTIRQVEGTAPGGFIEIRGVGAGAFDPDAWSDAPPFALPDIRSPLLTPRQGKFRNIYAPSVLQTDMGYRIYYGAWDGVETGNDRIYSIDTTNFLNFSDRRTVIEHGEFHHVCNVSAIRRNNGDYALACTALDNGSGLNKPIILHSSDGEAWSDSLQPHRAKRADLLTMNGYPAFETADINGMNVLLEEAGQLNLFFCNFKDFGKVFRATSNDGRHFEFTGAVLKHPMMVNDVKKLVSLEGKPSYLMALHANRGQLEYTLSKDLTRFPEPKVLARHRDESDRYMVAVGWVIDESNPDASRVLGYLYGAGAVPSLDANRIFARWFQDKLIIEDATGRTIEPVAALGPDRQLFACENGRAITGRVKRIKGNVVQAAVDTIQLEAGRCYEIVR